MVITNLPPENLAKLRSPWHLFLLVRLFMTSAPRLTSSKGSPRTSTASMLKLLAIAPCKNQYGRCNHPVCNFARQDPQLIWPNLASGSSTCCSSSSSNTGWSSWTLPCRVDPSVPGMQLEQMHVQKADSLFGLQ